MAPKNGATKEAEAKKPTEKEALEKLKESGVVAEGRDFYWLFRVEFLHEIFNKF